MHQVFLSAEAVHNFHNFYGELSYKKSPLGLEFVLCSGSAQTIIGNYPVPKESLWLAVLLEGSGSLQINDRHIILENKHILYGASGDIDYVSMSMDDHFKMLTIEIPHTVFYKRLVDPLSIRAGVLKNQSAMYNVLLNFLTSISQEVSGLHPEKFHPIEVALTELFVSSLSESIQIRGFTDAGHAKSFQKICDSIEEHLSDCDLSLPFIAEINRVSVRYIQKLFSEVNLSFAQYIRQSRLELCRRDMANTIHQDLTISEICYRWGFNDLSYFSRIFRNQYGVPPRKFKESLVKAAVKKN